MTPWAKRGVLLLNACLTVRAHNANSHAGQGWENFTVEVLRTVAKSTRGIVFLSWGSPAHKRVDSIGIDQTKHCVLKSVHPSPLSAARGFFECKHFIKANEWLRTRYGIQGEIEWDCLADGKQEKGLSQKESTQRSNDFKSDMAPEVSRAAPASSSEDTLKILNQKFEIGTDDDDVMVKNANEFDEEELAGIP